MPAEDTPGGGHAHRIHPGHVGRGGLQGGDDPLIVVVRVGGSLGEPHHLLREDGLSVDDGGHLSVGAARVKADAAAAQVAAHRLGIALLGGHLVAVKGPLAAHAVGGLHGLIDGLAAAEVDLEAALHPQEHFDEPVHIVDVGLSHLRGAVDKGLIDGHLAAGPLHRHVQGLLGVLQKGRVELAQGKKAGVQLRHMFHRDFNSKVLHCMNPPVFVGNTQGIFLYRLSAFFDLSSIFS